MSEWISVKDRMPEPGVYDHVLTFEILTHIETLEKIPHIDLEDPESLHFDPEDGCAYSDGGGENITHWMPPPEPPHNV